MMLGALGVCEVVGLPPYYHHQVALKEVDTNTVHLFLHENSQRLSSSSDDCHTSAHEASAALGSVKTYLAQISSEL